MLSKYDSAVKFSLSLQKTLSNVCSLAGLKTSCPSKINMDVLNMRKYSVIRVAEKTVLTKDFCFSVI